jgi:hypothetical protein
MSELNFSSNFDVVRLCGGEGVSSAVLNLENGSVRLLCGHALITVAVDQLPELNRLGVFPGFIVDYLRASLVL